MDNAEIVKNYINNSRIVTKPYQYSEEKYRFLYWVVTMNKDVPYDYPKLELCYSLKKTCEQVTVKGCDQYLIHDVAIGRFMDSMNACILCKDVPKWIVEKFIRKCYAEEYYSMGDLIRAYISKLYVDEIKEKYESTTIEKDYIYPNRSRMIMLQEFFIILHEIAHFRMSKYTKEDYQKKISEKRAFLIQNDTMIKMIESGLEPAFSKALLDNLKFEKNTHLLGNIEKYAVDPEYWKAYYSWLQEYYSYDKNIEEIICDEFAVFSLEGSLFPLLGPNYLDYTDSKLAETEYKDLLYKACYLALQNLYYLMLIENDARRISHQNNGKGTGPYSAVFSFMPDIQPRKRNYIRAIMRHESGGKSDSQKRKIGVKWANLAKYLDSLYDDFEDIFQGNYSCCDKDKLVFEQTNGLDDETIRRNTAKSLAEILFW